MKNINNKKITDIQDYIESTFNQKYECKIIKREIDKVSKYRIISYRSRKSTLEEELTMLKSWYK